MKEESYVYDMLQRAEMNKRKAFKQGDDLKYQIYSGIMRQLKIVLEIDNKKVRRGRLKKTIEYNNYHVGGEINIAYFPYNVKINAEVIEND